MSMSSIVIESVTDLRKAVTLATLGLPLKKRGVFILQSQEEPDGVAHFIFESGFGDIVKKYCAVYDAQTGDAEWEEYMLDLEKNSTVPKTILAQIKERYQQSLVAHSHKLLDGYFNCARDIQLGKIAVFMRIGGTPVYDKSGAFIGYEDFDFKRIK